MQTINRARTQLLQNLGAITKQNTPYNKQASQLRRNFYQTRPAPDFCDAEALPPKIPAFAPAFRIQPYLTYHHRFVNSLHHVINRKQADAHRT